nr:collagen alpha-1(XV) chain-like [Penaeus vannamei]
MNIIDGPRGPPGIPGSPAFLPKKYNFGSPLPHDTMFDSFPPTSNVGMGINSASILRFTSRTSMLQEWAYHTPGALAYVLDDDSLFLRAARGWREVAFGEMLTPQIANTPLRPTPTPMNPNVETLPEELATDLSTGRAWRGEPMTTDVEDNEWNTMELRLAALNEPWQGSFHDVASPDYTCYRQARSAGLRGTFRALLSGQRHDVASLVRFADREQPIVNLRGDLVLGPGGT